MDKGALQQETLKTLAALVACDTRNPPRKVDGGGIFEVIRQALPAGFQHHVEDLGDGCVSMLSTRGTPDLLINIHVDTVPAEPGWQQDPLLLRVDGERAVGLGAADIKGAAACIITAVKQVAGDVALLFTSDEEAGSSRCVKHFLETSRTPWRGVLVGEPTQCKAVLAHRGIATCTGDFSGTAGHASGPRVLKDSAVHEMVRWAHDALAFAEAHEQDSFAGLTGVRFNLGFVEGGTKPNMIASSTKVRFGVRPLPHMDPVETMQGIQGMARNRARVTWTTGFVAPPLPKNENLLGAAAELAGTLGLPHGDAVDFWTEAALFSAAGLPAVVFGPGDIAQAHTAGEWVALSQLDEATAVYMNVLERLGA